METSISIHLGTDTRVSVPDRADAYLSIEGRGATLDLFLGTNDHDRIESIDKLAEALLEARVRCMAAAGDTSSPTSPSPSTARSTATDERPT